LAKRWVNIWLFCLCNVLTAFDPSAPAGLQWCFSF
jgi:hypothetical protein